MKKTLLIYTIVVTFLFSLLNIPLFTSAEVDWDVKKELRLDAEPLDVSPSDDGQYIFILVPGEILIYSKLENKTTDRIPVNSSFDKMKYSAKDRSLILTSRSEKMLKIFQVEIRKEINISKLAVKGPEDASVTIAVFSDYQ